MPIKRTDWLKRGRKFRDNDGIWKKLYEWDLFVKIIKNRYGISCTMKSGIKMIVPWDRIIWDFSYNPKKTQIAKYRVWEEVRFSTEDKGIQSMIITSIAAWKEWHPRYSSIDYDYKVWIEEVNLYRTKQDLLMDETP